jgi:diguanylate cyclase (GGDEF)-like protein
VAREQADIGEGGPGSRKGSAAGQLAREVSALQADLLGKLQREMPGADVSEFASAAQRLAEAFGTVTAAAVDPLASRQATPATGRPATPETPAAPAAEPAPLPAVPPPGEHASLYRPGQMRRRLDQLLEMHRRYEHPFCLVVFDVHGPAARNGTGGDQTALTVVGAALRESIRLVDEAFPLDEEALCVLAPNQDTVGGVQMSERLLRQLEDLEAAGGLPIGISAGVAACPEHGGEAESLLQKADEAMWRARAVGQPVGVGRLEPLQDR